MIGSLFLIPAAVRAVGAAVVAGVLDAVADHQRPDPAPPAEAVARGERLAADVRREPTVGELGLCGRTDDDQLGPDAARWVPELRDGAR